MSYLHEARGAPRAYPEVLPHTGGMNTTFDALGLNEKLVASVAKLGYREPTPIQSQTIPVLLEGRDCVASAQTGTGKTAAFVLPTLQLLAASADQRSPKAHYPEALIVSPTRELATQIARAVEPIAADLGLASTLVVGGARLRTQINKLKRPCHVLVATPGRLLDMIEHQHIRLDHVHYFVLDEADRMLDMGFWPQVRRVMHLLPKRHQTMLFSATIPSSIQATIDALLTDPVRIEIAPTGTTADTVAEHLCPVTQGQKQELLLALLACDKDARALVFCRTKSRCELVAKALKQAGVSCDLMHADRRQRERTRALDRFRSGRIQVLVATDVMSRGIDVSGIDLVVNYDVPQDPEDYVHRIGRSGRAGVTGAAYTFMAPDEISALREIEYFTHERIDLFDLPDFAYDTGRIVPSKTRATSRASRSLFSGSRGRGPRAGRYGRHY